MTFAAETPLLSGGAKRFVATPRDAPARILGFYTLSPASVEFSRAPAVVTRGLGRYEIPVYRLGRPDFQ